MQKAVSGDAIQHKQDLMIKTQSFESKYPNAKFTTDGKVKTSFEELQKPYNDTISDNEKKLKDNNGAYQQCVSNYNTENNKNKALNSDITTFESNAKIMNSLMNGTISGGGATMDVREACNFNGDEATVNESAIDKKFPTNDPKTKDANELRRSELKSAAQFQCSEYNNKARSNANILKGHGADSINALKTQKQTSDNQLKLLGDQRVSTGETVQSLMDAINIAKTQKDDLGTKADYDTDAKEINELVDKVAKDVDLAKKEAEADKAEQAYKRAKKNGASKTDKKLLLSKRDTTKSIYENDLFKRFFPNNTV
jgi:hypothetical protein